MPITWLWWIGCLIFFGLLIGNIAIPLIFPRYELFWMFRKDPMREAEKNLENAVKNKEIKTIKKIIKEVNDEN